MAFPILFSILFFSEGLNILKVLGLIAAFVSVFLCIYKPEATSPFNAKLFLPFVIFIGTGVVDSLIKYTQHYFVKNDTALLFSSTVFMVALILGLIYNLFFERNAFYTINAGGSSHIYGHNFVLPEKVLYFLRRKYKSIRDTNKKILKPASNNKAFCIEIEIKNIKPD